MPRIRRCLRSAGVGIRAAIDWCATTACTPRARRAAYRPVASRLVARDVPVCRRQPVAHDGQWGVAREPQANDREQRGLGGQVERGGRVGIGDGVVLEEDGAWGPALPREVVEEAAQRHPAVHLAVGDGRAEAPAPDEQALVDHLLDGAADRRARERKALCESHLVLEGVAGLEASVGDRGAQALGQAVVERDRRRPVDAHVHEPGLS